MICIVEDQTTNKGKVRHLSKSDTRLYGVELIVTIESAASWFYC